MPQSREDQLRDYIIREVETSQVFQQSRIREANEYIKRYEAKRSISGLLGWGDDPRKNPKDEPWEGASDVGIPIDAYTVEGLLPRFLKVCFGAKPIVWVRGHGKEDIPKAPLVQEALNYQLGRLIKIYRKMKLIFKTVILEGDAFAKCVWDKKTRRFNKVKYFLQNPTTGELLLNEDGTPIEVKKDFKPLPDIYGVIPEVVRIEEQEEKTIYEGPMIYGRTIREIIIPKNATSPDIEEWDWICDTYEVTFDWLIRREGDISEGKFKNIDKIREEILSKSSDHQKAMRTPIQIFEWYGKYDINEDEKDEEIIAFVCPKYRVLLGWMLSPFPVRPFFHYQIIPMEGRPYGKGVPEFLMGLRDMVDAIFNQMIDRGSISNNPPIIVPPEHEDELNPFGPGVKWKSDNPTAYRALQLPNAEQLEFSKLEFLLAMVQKLFGVTDFTPPPQMGAQRTATGIMTIVSELNIKFDDMIRALQDINEDLYEFIVFLNSENLEDEFMYRLTEQPGNPFKSINRAYWAGNFDFEAVGNSVNINRQIEQDRAILAYNTVVNSYGRNPALSELTLLDVTQNLFRAIDVRNIRLKTEEEIAQEKQQQLQIAQQQLQLQRDLEVAKIQQKGGQRSAGAIV
jgi:hypothetical protein